MGTQTDLFVQAQEVIKQVRSTSGTGSDHQPEPENGQQQSKYQTPSFKEFCKNLSGNSKERKKITSMVANYFKYEDELRRFYKQNKLNVKKNGSGLSKTLIKLILAELLYSRNDYQHLYAHFKESKYLSKFADQIKKVKETVELPPLQEKLADEDGEEQDGKKKNKRKNKKKKNKDQNSNDSQANKRFKKEVGDPFADQKTVPAKYLRVNRIKTSIEAVIRELVNKYGWTQVGGRFDTFAAFLKRLFAIEKLEFMVDYHFPDDLLVVPASGSMFFQSLLMYENGEIIFQDKASLLVMRCVPLKAGSKIGDICCAPGMKTAAIASMLNNNCEMFSVDMDDERLQTMETLMKKLSITCTKIMKADFTKCTADDFELNKKEMDVLFLDPSCSGSGMLKRGDEQNDDRVRLMKLASFQTKMVGHAMSLRPRWLVYSTCSNSIWENEFVVCKSLEEGQNAADYELVEACPEWPQRGNHKFSCQAQVIRTGPNRGTQGFFTAVFRRLN